MAEASRGGDPPFMYQAAAEYQRLISQTGCCAAEIRSARSSSRPLPFTPFCLLVILVESKPELNVPLLGSV